MSAPEPNFDQLLSDHLDGQLDEADAQMLRERMRDDPALQSQFDAMLADRQDLRAMFAAGRSAGPQLGSQFAARVLTESRRRRLQMREVHPASPSGAKVEAPVLACEKPDDAPERNPWAMVMGSLTIAAAVLLIASLAVRKGRVGGDGSAIAQHQDAMEPTPSLPTDVDPHERAPSRDIDVPSAVKETPSKETPSGSDDPSMSPMIAAADHEAIERDAPSSESERFDAATRPSPDAVATMPTPSARLDRSASVSMGDGGATPGNPLFRGAMMVYEIRLSPQGRRANVLSDAMRQVDLQDAHRLSINRDVIAAAEQADTFDEEAPFQLIFLQASAKKVDRLFLNLRQKPRSVEAVGLSLVTDAPLLQMAGNLARVDATKVQHDEPLSFEMEDNDNAELAAFRELLGEQSFLPLQPIPSNEDHRQPESFSSTGDDVVTRVLILVR